MFKAIVTDAVISKGYGDNPALRFSEGGENGSSNVRFRIGKTAYDSRVEGNQRWINMTVKAFGYICDRIKKMELKEGSHVHIIGRLDKETWDDNGTQRSDWVLIVDEIEYAYSGNQNNGNQNGSNGTGANTAGQGGAGTPTPEAQNGSAGSPANAAGDGQPPQGEFPQGFEGHEPFTGGKNPFIPDENQT